MRFRKNSGVDKRFKTHERPGKYKHRRAQSLSGVVLRCRTNRTFWFGVVVGRLNSECPQQDRANENKHGAYGQHIQSQGKVHEMPPLLMW
jgi:hypothetical protein